MKFLNLNNVLCLSPHPEDVEIGMMGTILKYNQTKFDVLCLTKGGAKGYDDTNKWDRRKEVNNVWDFPNSYVTNHVQVYHSKFDYFEDCTEPGWINYIEKPQYRYNFSLGNRSGDFCIWNYMYIYRYQTE